MTMAKGSVETPLKELPDDATLEDIQYHLYILEKVQQGLRSADQNGTITQEEVTARLKKWTSK